MTFFSQTSFSKFLCDHVHTTHTFLAMSILSTELGSCLKKKSIQKVKLDTTDYTVLEADSLCSETCGPLSPGYRENLDESWKSSCSLLPEPRASCFQSHLSRFRWHHKLRKPSCAVIFRTSVPSHRGSLGSRTCYPSAWRRWPTTLFLLGCVHCRQVAVYMLSF